MRLLCITLVGLSLVAGSSAHAESKTAGARSDRAEQPSSFVRGFDHGRDHGRGYPTKLEGDELQSYRDGVALGKVYRAGAAVGARSIDDEDAEVAARVRRVTKDFRLELGDATAHLFADGYKDGLSSATRKYWTEGPTSQDWSIGKVVLLRPDNGTGVIESYDHQTVDFHLGDFVDPNGARLELGLPLIFRTQYRPLGRQAKEISLLNRAPR